MGRSRTESVIGWCNVVVSLSICLLSIAPFTPAMALFTVTVPTAAWLARRGQRTNVLLAIALWLIAIALGPVSAHQLLYWPAALWFLAIFLLAAYALFKSTGKLRRPRQE
jgi:hypothetical protein